MTHPHDFVLVYMGSGEGAILAITPSLSCEEIIKIVGEEDRNLLESFCSRAERGHFLYMGAMLVFRGVMF